MIIFKHIQILRYLLLITLLVSGCQDQQVSDQDQQKSEGLETVTLALNWMPEAEHGGFYAASINGIYEAAGFDVEILPGGPGSPVIQRVGTKRVTYGVSNADRIVMGRAQQAKIVALLAPLQHSPRCIIVHQESEIQSLDSLQNVTLAMSDAAAFSHFLKQSVPLTNVQLVRYTGSLAPFLRDQTFAQQGYVFSEPILAAQQGANVRALKVSDIGFDPYSSVLITHQDLVDLNPKRVQAFVEATRLGWESYLNDPEPIHEYIHSLNPEMTLEVMNEGFDSLKQLCEPANGEMLDSRWQTLIDQLETLKLIEKDIVTVNEIVYSEQTSSGN